MSRKNDPIGTYVRRMAKILAAIEYLGRYCKYCNFDGFLEPWFMDFHHKEAETKLYEVKNYLYNGSFDNHREEIDKCILICGRCHRKDHSNHEMYELHNEEIHKRLEEFKNNGGHFKMAVLTDEIKKQIINLAKKNLTQTEIANQLNISTDAVKYLKNIENIKIIKKPARLPKTQIIKLLNAKYTIRGIAKKLNIGRESIRNFVNKELIKKDFNGVIRFYKKKDS